MNEKRRILLIEDNFVDRKLVSLMFEEGILQEYELKEAISLKSGIDIIKQYDPHLVMLDLYLPDAMRDQGFNIIREMFPSLPIVILTGMADKNLSTHMIRNGAQDYLIKGEFEVVLLEKTLNYAIERQRLIHLMRDAEQKVMTSIMETENRERNRIAQELHDSLGQQLTASLFSLNTFKKNILNKVDDKHLSQIDKIVDQLNTIIDETRVISHNLVPISVRDFGYSSAVSALLEDLEGNVDATLHFNTNFEKRFNPQVEMTLYRITQEALNNALKYAKAKNISIQFVKFNNEINLSIEDDGIGFLLKNIDKDKSFGIESMKYRINACNGTMELDTSPNKGTCLTFNIPFNS